MITTLTLGIIGVLSLLSAIVCEKCKVTYDGRRKHHCLLADDGIDGFISPEVEEKENWFDSIQTTLGGLIAVDWAKSGTVIERVLSVHHFNRKFASLIWELPSWLMDEKGWEKMPILIIEQGEPGFGGNLNPVLVHQGTLINGIATFLKTMKEGDNLMIRDDGIYMKPDIELSFELVKVGDRSRYEVTFVIAD